MSTKISASKVDELFRKCLFTDQETAGKTQEQLLEQALTAAGLTMSVGFNKQRLTENEAMVKEMLQGLPKEFFQKEGGGMSFMKMPFDTDGNQWGEQPTAQQLLLMGVALGYADYCLPKELWSALPGGVPYVVLNMDRETGEKISA